MILVSDTSVLIDLDRAAFLESVFDLPHEFAVPDVLYRAELAGEWGDRLRGLGLRVEELSSDSVANALRYRQLRSILSVPDSFALALAKERQWPLLTGDGRLRELAGVENVECHGVPRISDGEDHVLARTPGDVAWSAAGEQRHRHSEKECTHRRSTLHSTKGRECRWRVERKL